MTFKVFVFLKFKNSSKRRAPSAPYDISDPASLIIPLYIHLDSPITTQVSIINTDASYIFV